MLSIVLLMIIILLSITLLITLMMLSIFPLLILTFFSPSHHHHHSSTDTPSIPHTPQATLPEGTHRTTRHDTHAPPRSPFLSTYHSHTTTTPRCIAAPKSLTQQNPTANGFGLWYVPIATTVFSSRFGSPSAYNSCSYQVHAGTTIPGTIRPAPSIIFLLTNELV